MREEIYETITLTREGNWWIATDETTGIVSQGETRVAALENLDEAVQITEEAREADTEAPTPDAPWFAGEGQ